MKKKINAQLIYIGIFSIISTLIMVLVIFYNIFRQQVFDDLKAYAQIINSIDDIDHLDEDRGGFIQEYGIRVTVINDNGDVIYDNMADYPVMENHGNRPEVAEAFKNGEGSYVRISETFDKNTYYYALKTDDNRVLRVAKDAGGIIMLFGNSIPALVIVCVLLCIICVIMAKLLTQKLMEPIVRLGNNIDNVDESQVYDEMVPFVTTIKKQHRDIISNAKMRQEFTANVSHELKTPLTAISGYAELIENGMAGEEETVRFASEIRKSAKRLLTLINDIMKLSELDDSSIRQEFGPVDLYETAAGCIEMLDLNVKSNDVTLSLFGTRCIVNGNRQMLEEVIYNLCDNAIRYNNRGGSVTVMVREENGRKILSVKDTGIGISKENQDRIFERFYRVDKSRSKQTGGTGLGLAIVKHIAMSHGAEIEINSALGLGTEIKVIFN